eukprot:CAMPEP_0198653190 /NCGR_PEP_ID=MMETSP1467-20131203/6886_1 /TAXON_ID=1462469 /ORGANISM="unid. sp., Strain CCMP2135" /LENGTH=115 /DNA_ID=CAMNT_0044389147 /DNA_START=126 /DNA_END=471 /DNA_ORIENTATION=+
MRGCPVSHRRCEDLLWEPRAKKKNKKKKRSARPVAAASASDFEALESEAGLVRFDELLALLFAVMAMHSSRGFFVSGQEQQIFFPDLPSVGAFGAASADCVVPIAFPAQLLRTSH